jgi:hypothetical protein
MQSNGARKSLRIAIMLALAAWMQAGGCRHATESQQVVESFVKLYYGEASAAQAVKLCTGEAEHKLRREIQAIAGVAPDTGADRPPVTYTLISQTDPGPTTRTYVYKVVPHTSDIGSLTATIDVVQRNGRWLVASLTETHSVP